MHTHAHTQAPGATASLLLGAGEFKSNFDRSLEIAKSLDSILQKNPNLVFDMQQRCPCVRIQYQFICMYICIHISIHINVHTYLRILISSSICNKGVPVYAFNTNLFNPNPTI